MKLKIKNYSGFTLLEMLVVITIFSALGILVTRSVLLTLGGGQKTENLVRVRENLNYAQGVIVRQLRNANSISDCTNSDTSSIQYVDQNGNTSSFSCVGIGKGLGYVASNSAELTDSNINVTSCSFTCVLGTAATPDSITINLQAQDASSSGVLNSQVTTTTEVSLRDY